MKLLLTTAQSRTTAAAGAQNLLLNMDQYGAGVQHMSYELAAGSCIYVLPFLLEYSYCYLLLPFVSNDAAIPGKCYPLEQ